MDNFRYPSTEEGIDALVNKPDDPDIKWPEGGYIQRLPQDPWNRPYLYLQPGNNGEYDIYTFGRDGEQGGEGPDGDIGNWSLN
jgi:general secretion pathway protein G